jgi:2-keto-4-pentenoate hydratase/2-oxohepta-3-ene-1,7-dioic acid hydratase in catechol pathway
MRLIAFLTKVMTLEPGDIIATGTPACVARAHNPPQFMNAGDVVEVEVQGIGTLSNRIRGAA